MHTKLSQALWESTAVLRTLMLSPDLFPKSLTQVEEPWMSDHSHILQRLSIRVHRSSNQCLLCISTQLDAEDLKVSVLQFLNLSENTGIEWWVAKWITIQCNMLRSMEVILQHMESKMFLLWWEGHKHTTVAGGKKTGFISDWSNHVKYVY